MTRQMPWMTWKRLGLASRLVLASGFVLTVVSISYFSVSVRSEIELRRAELLQSLSHELDFIIPALAEPAVVGDYTLIQQMVNARVQQPEIARVTWIDSRGNRIESSLDEIAAEAPQWFADWVDFPRFESSKQIVVGGESYGNVELQLTSTLASNKIWRDMRDKLEILLLGMVVLLAFIIGIVTNGLRPLYALRAAAYRFGRGEHSMRMTPAGPPEMITCANAFNSMADNTERLLRTLRETSARNAQLAIIVEQSNVPIVSKDLNGIITSWNSAASEVYGYSAEEAIGRPISLLHVPSAETEFKQILARVRTGLPRAFETKYIARDGSILDVFLSVSPLYDEDNNHIGETGVTRDITRQKRAEQALFKEKERAQVTLASIADAVVTTDIAGRVDYINPVAEKLLGWRTDEAYGHALRTIFHATDEATGLPIDDPVTKVLDDHRTIEVRGDAVLVSRTGVRCPIEHSAAPISSPDGQTVGVVLVFRDVSESHNMARQLSWQASHDELTALVNRREFLRHLNLLVESAHEDRRQHALLYMDLDQFKIVNDTCGHVVGDDLLRQLSALLSSRIRGLDTIARLGGDEFGVLLADCPPERAMEVAENLRKTISEFHFHWQDKTFAIGVSIGVVGIEGDRQSNSDILGIADAACYSAKDKGRNQVQASPNDRELSQRRGEMLWVSRINTAFEQNRFVLYYQRIVPILQQAEQEIHYEVLLRMLDQEGAVIAPMAFIPAAERYNLMRAIDRKVIAMAFAEFEQRAAVGSPEDSWTLSINLSGDTLSDAQFLDFLKSQFSQFAVDPGKICFEVTETVAIAKLSYAVALIKELKAMGCRFSLDDFGSGVSSFGYLKNLPVDYLKIDGSFVRDMAHDPIDAAMVAAISNIGHVMGITTIAEWVENDGTLAMLKSIGVDYAQGYLFDRPRAMVDICGIAPVAGRSAACKNDRASGEHLLLVHAALTTDAWGVDAAHGNVQRGDERNLPVQRVFAGARS
ncbi:MAG: EAL domain-containing protein [Betaproteobacteria bacterium]